MLKRLWVIGLVTLTALVSTALPARATTSDMDAANRAGSWLVAQLADGHLSGPDAGSEYGNTVLGLIGVAATDDPALRPGIDAMTGYLKTNAAAQATSASRAAGLAIAADALGLAPTAFGIDPVKVIAADTAADGSMGSWPSAYGQAFAMLGLLRAGTEPTDAHVGWLVAQQEVSGAFGYHDSQTGTFVADPDSTSLAILALSALDRADAKAAAERAATWLSANQQSDGSWAADSPVNTTALAGMALAARGQDVSKALGWVKTQQDAPGGLRFGGNLDAYATAQALPFLAGTSYRTVVWKPRPVALTPSVTQSAPAATASAVPTVAPSTPAASGAPANPDLPLYVGGGVMLAAAAAGGTWLLRRKK